jgi:hypothetical protein
MVGGSVSMIYERVLAKVSYDQTTKGFIIYIPETGKDPRERLVGV